jgi:hypothetical protein
MTCEWAIACNNIQVEPDTNDLSIIGIIGSLTVASLPGDVEGLKIVLRLTGTPHEKASCVLAITKPDGRLLTGIAPQPIELRGDGISHVFLPLGPFRVDVAGTYGLVITLDGSEARRLVLPIDTVRVM